MSTRNLGSFLHYLFLSFVEPSSSPYYGILRTFDPLCLCPISVVLVRLDAVYLKAL